MKNWRNTLTNILRTSGGEAHLSEIYSQVEILGTQLGPEWKAVTRGALERNCSDCDAWDGKHDVFSLKEKGSGNWFLRTNAFKKDILDPKTNFFILTTGKKEHRDRDFEIYTWNIHKNSKLKPGDLFIYRISQKVSSNNQFYFFGAGKIDSIFYPDKNSPHYQQEGDVCAKISNPVYFNQPIYQKTLKPKDFESRRDDWMYTFGQYGMDEILLDKFLFLLNRGTGKNYSFDQEENEISVKAHNKIFSHDYFVPNSESQTTSSRGKWQRYFREDIVLPNYEFKCAITGIKTTSLLTAAHILRWADYEDKRLDPTNGICLSQLVDKCFENNLIYIDDTYKVRISDEVKKDKDLFDQLKTYEGKRIFLPSNKNAHPNKKYLKIHREKIK
jgi:putative restriction endonuclease